MTIRIVCRHGNEVPLDPNDPTPPCGCMLIDGTLHPCHGCPPSCGNCL